MDWEIYSSRFAKAAQDRGDHYIERCLAYAKRLNDQSLPIIYSPDHLGKLTGYDPAYLRYVAYKQRSFYREFSIPKKSGGVRSISEPLPNLKSIQQWILTSILYKLEPSVYAKAFVPQRSIKENARFHRSQEMVFTVDIRDFFPSLSVKRINNIFLSLGYERRVAYYLTRLCSLDGGLPQGAPTSPALSNIIFSPTDNRIAKYCTPLGIRYTRYADDLTFSGNFSVSDLLKIIRRELSALELTLNDSKTRLMKKHERQIVTGVVVNEKLNATRELRRGLRQSAYYIQKYGLENHINRIDEKRGNYLLHLIGQATLGVSEFLCKRDFV
ncbi:reverse transcriptase family protein [Herbaspirillum rubrisubalbicans]|uniref:reverse transcriptase family protein n=1 Tax=Herbaspirillum rubrisubalbicans TaxID=80842 RepID=UPI0015C5469B|nr:reverse transcriptase family protein [Herbaspirillum rubrisubalbicans]